MWKRKWAVNKKWVKGTHNLQAHRSREGEVLKNYRKYSQSLSRREGVKRTIFLLSPTNSLSFLEHLPFMLPTKFSYPIIVNQKHSEDLLGYFWLSGSLFKHQRISVGTAMSYGRVGKSTRNVSESTSNNEQDRGFLKRVRRISYAWFLLYPQQVFKVTYSTLPSSSHFAPPVEGELQVSEGTAHNGSCECQQDCTNWRRTSSGYPSEVCEVCREVIQEKRVSIERQQKKKWP